MLSGQSGDGSDPEQCEAVRNESGRGGLLILFVTWFSERRRRRCRSKCHFGSIRLVPLARCASWSAALERDLGWGYVQEHQSAPQLRAPGDPAEVEAAATQYVQKVAGVTKPSATNRRRSYAAIAAVGAATHTLLDSLVTQAPRA